MLTRVNAARPDYIGGVVSPAREFGGLDIDAKVIDLHLEDPAHRDRMLMRHSPVHVAPKLA